MRVSGFLQDLRIATKQIRRTPGLSLVSVLMLSIGIGASTTVFTALYRVVLQPIPVREIDRLVVFNAPGLRGGDALEYWSQLSTLSALCSYQSGGVTESESTFPTRISAAVVSAGFFTVIEAVPQIGRQFAPADEESGPYNFAIISHYLWIEKYGSDPSVLGRTITLDGISHTIVGVMPEAFRYPGRTDVWVQRSRGVGRLSLGQDEFNMSGLMRLAMLGRLREGVTLPQCQAEADGLFEQLKVKGSSPGDGVRLLILRDLLVRDYRSAFLGLLAAAGSLLLISLANASNIQLTRAVAREKDTWIRVCLGASPLILVRLFLAEALVTAMAAGALGVLFAHWGVAVVRMTGQRYVPSLSEMGVSTPALVFALLLSLFVALAIEFLPILHMLAKDPLDWLKTSGGLAITGVRRHAGNAAAVIEVAVALVLMITATLALQTVLRLSEIATGIDPTGIVSMSIELPESKYAVSVERRAVTQDAAHSTPVIRELSGHPLEQFQQNLAEGISGLPGIAAVGFVSQLPLSSSTGRSLSVSAPGGQDGLALYYYISGDYFQTMGIPITRGRYFDKTDTIGSRKSLIVNQSLAQLYWPDSDAIGQSLRVSDESEPREVVGVVGDVKQTGLAKPVGPQFYIPYLQPYRGRFPALQMTLVARTDADPKAVVPLLQAVIVSLDKDLAVFRVRTMQEVVLESISAYRFRASLFGSIASLGLLLAACGVFAVVAFMVKTRAHEIGIRIALGAEPGQIIATVLKHGALLGFLGVAAGTGAAVGLTRFVASFLYGVEPLDTSVFVGSAVIVFSTALVACVAPAVIATRVDPARVLRHE
jgi:putative ABC transport system permease protein